MDIKTILICLVIISLFLGFFTYAVRKTQLTFPGINYWIISHFLIAGGYLLLSMGNKIPDFFSIALPRTLFVWAGIIRVFGVQRFFKKKITTPHKIIALITVVLFELLIIYFTYFQIQLHVPTVVVGIFLSGIVIVIGIQILKNKIKDNEFTYIFTAIIFFMFAAILLGRVIGWILFPAIRNVFASTFLNNLQFLSSMVIDITWAIMFFVLYNQKLTLQLKSLNSQKDKFFSILAHDLRNPFNNILGYSLLLLNNLRNYDLNKIEDHIKVVYKMSKQTYNLLEEILMWAKSQSGSISYKPEELNFSELCQGIIESLKLSAIAKNITINYAENNINVSADENMLKTILRNLISNAIKFTHPDGIINISAKSDETNGIITISDNGVGIDKNNFQKLWEITTHYSTTGTASEKGTGFGLILCKEFVEKNGGRIWVESVLGKGSDFTFTIPLSK
ncbi:MAG: HAMP domain-containing histidine kinase [Chitinophagaceae bacterium]|nr:HAMP domain-containing histidine kinase [Chitinophagaceae bacterium]